MKQNSGLHDTMWRFGPFWGKSRLALLQHPQHTCLSYWVRFMWLTLPEVCPHKLTVRRQASYPPEVQNLQSQQRSAPRESVCPTSEAHTVVWVQTVSPWSLSVHTGRQSGQRWLQLYSDKKEDTVFMEQGMGSKPEGSGGNGVAKGKYSVLPTFFYL